MGDSMIWLPWGIFAIILCKMAAVTFHRFKVNPVTRVNSIQLSMVYSEPDDCHSVVWYLLKQIQGPGWPGTRGHDGSIAEGFAICGLRGRVALPNHLSTLPLRHDNASSDRNPLPLPVLSPVCSQPVRSGLYGKGISGEGNGLFLKDTVWCVSGTFRKVSAEHLYFLAINLAAHSLLNELT